MTTARTEPTIVVRVEVEVPIQGTATRIAPAVRPPRVKESADDFRIDLPQDRVTPVRQLLTGPNMGRICAKGRAFRPSATSTVWAKVYPGERNLPGVGSPEIDATPPMGDNTVKQMNTDANGFWEFSSATASGELFGAQCGSASTVVRSTLAVWALFSGDATFYPRIVQFTGLCSDHTECGSGSGSGSGFVSFEVRQQATALAPRQWQVVGVGFVGEAAETFNDLWLLTRCCTGAVWDNGAGDPRVELRCDGDWFLTFCCGDCAVRFRKPAADWKRLGANVFTELVGFEGRCDKVPPAITIIPV
jgi:hypothetical protein